MKNIKYLFIMALVVMLSVSCSKDDDYVDNPLVGVWKKIFPDDYNGDRGTWTFNKNLSGSFYVYNNSGYTENTIFTWSTDGGELTVIIGGETSTVSYSISGNKLTLGDDDGYDDGFYTRQ